MFCTTCKQLLSGIPLVSQGVGSHCRGLNSALHPWLHPQLQWWFGEEFTAGFPLWMSAETSGLQWGHPSLHWWPVCPSLASLSPWGFSTSPVISAMATVCFPGSAGLLLQLKEQLPQPSIPLAILLDPRRG